MNFVAHLVVGLDVAGVDPASEVALGAVLPDFASMVGVRLDRSLLPPGVAEGVDLHHRTDSAFHGHPWFVDRVKVDVASLEAAGLPRGAARASAHVGTELLLDGVLLEDDDVAAALARLVEELDVERLGPAGAARSGDWQLLFDRMRQGSSRAAYGSPELVAERLRSMLARRPRLVLPVACGPALVDHLTVRRRDVVAMAPTVVADVIARSGR